MAAFIRLTAALACVLILLGFAGFVADQAGSASKTQVGKLGGEVREPVPSARGEAMRERQHSRAREVIDDANDGLLSPFTGLVPSPSIWVRRLVPTLLALIVYGAGLLFLANFLPGPRRKGVDWRTA